MCGCGYTCSVSICAGLSRSIEIVSLRPLKFTVICLSFRLITVNVMVEPLTWQLESRPWWVYILKKLWPVILLGWWRDKCSEKKSLGASTYHDVWLHWWGVRLCLRQSRWSTPIFSDKSRRIFNLWPSPCTGGENIFEKIHPEATAIFLFDNVPSHRKVPDNALNSDKQERKTAQDERHNLGWSHPAHGW